MLSNEEAKTIWYSMTNNELIDYIDNKFDLYKSMGYEVSHFRSSSYIVIDEKTIITNKMSYHEIKTIHEMEEYLKINKL